MNDYIYGVYCSNNYLIHGRTKGSKNGISTTPGYTAVGQKAKGHWVNGIYVSPKEPAKNYQQPYGYKPSSISNGYVPLAEISERERKRQEKKAAAKADANFVGPRLPGIAAGIDPRYAKRSNAMKGDPRFAAGSDEKFKAARRIARGKQLDNSAKYTTNEKIKAYRKYVPYESKNEIPDDVKKWERKEKSRYLDYHNGNDNAGAESAMKGDPRYAASSVKLDHKSLGTRAQLVGNKIIFTNKKKTNTQEIAADIAKKKHVYNTITHPLDTAKAKAKYTWDRLKKKTAYKANEAKKTATSIVNKLKKWFS